jgi:hypothetical protein
VDDVIKMWQETKTVPNIIIPTFRRGSEEYLVRIVGLGCVFKEVLSRCK